MDKEKFIESLRAKVMALFVAGAALLAFLGDAFPGLHIPHIVNLDALSSLVLAISIVVGTFIYGRSIRNTKTGGK